MQSRIWLCAATLIATITTGAHAQALLPCEGFADGERTLKVGSVLSLPAAATAITLGGLSGTPLPQPVNLSAIDSAHKWTPTATDLQNIEATRQGSLTLVVSLDGTNRCLIAIAVDTGRVLSQAPRVSIDAYSILEACQQLGSFEENIQRRRGQEATLILFADRGESTDGEPCYRSPRPPVVGRLIRIGVILPAKDSTATTFTHVSYEPCSLEEGAPIVFQSESKLPGAFQNDSRTSFAAQWLSSRKCYNESVNLVLNGHRSGIAVRQSYALQQHLRYRATLQTGVLFSESQVHTFALRPDGEDTKRIFDEGPINEGPEYTATILLYSLPRYVKTLFGGTAYGGRDIVNDQSIPDRIGGIIGVGLADPGDHFVAGFSFELISGVSAMFARHWSRGRVLTNGLNAGDEFVGAVEDIPTQRVWRSAWEWGLSLDLRYITKLGAR